MRLKLVFILILFTSTFYLTFAEEETLTITTYYPSPQGSYNELSANTINVGVGNQAGLVTFAGGGSDPVDAPNGSMYYNSSRGRFRFKDANGAPMNITTYNFAIQIKEKDGTVVAYAITGPGTPSNSIISLTRDSLDPYSISWRFGVTLDLDAKVYNYAIKMIDPDEQPTTIIQGDFIVEPELVNIP